MACYPRVVRGASRSTVHCPPIVAAAPRFPTVRLSSRRPYVFRNSEGPMVRLQASVYLTVCFRRRVSAVAEQAASGPIGERVRVVSRALLGRVGAGDLRGR